MVYASDRPDPFRRLWFTLGAFPVHSSALFSVDLRAGREVRGDVEGGRGRSLRPVWVHVVTSRAAGRIAIVLAREGFTPSA